MKLDPNKKYKVVDNDLINGYQVLTGKQLNNLLETAYKHVKRSKKWLASLMYYETILSIIRPGELGTI